MSKLSELAAQRFGMALDVAEVAEDAPGAEVLAALLSHRTHRRFLDTPVAEDTLNLLYACALSAPTSSWASTSTRHARRSAKNSA